MNSLSRNELWRGVFIFVAILILSVASFTTLPIKPNIYLVAIVLLAFVMQEPLLYGVFLLGVIGWAKYTPASTMELLVLGIMGVVLFMLRKGLVRETHIVLMGGSVLILQLIFWGVFFAQGIFSVLFFMEFFYNILALLLLYGVWLWAKKIFS